MSNKNGNYSGMFSVDEKGLALLETKTVPMAILGWLSIGFIVFGGAIPYIFQYLEINKRKNAAGFSLLVCLTLCIANILRVFFWVGKRFGLELLVQSVVMIVSMLVMLEISVRMNRKSVPQAQQTSVFKGDFFGSFWKWNDLKSYCAVLVAIGLICAFFTALFSGYIFYVEALGYMALGTEAMLGMPQLIRNCIRKSTAGMSVLMVLTWFIGDAFKTFYFFWTGSPAQFYVCSIIQVTVDVLIMLQVFVYGRRNSAARNQSYLPSHSAKL